MAAIESAAVIITDPHHELIPGPCDIAGCTHRASYAVGNYYLCGDCLIEGCEKKKIPVGTVVYRIPASHWF